MDTIRMEHYDNPVNTITKVAYLYSERATALEVAEFTQRCIAAGFTRFIEDDEQFNLIAVPEDYDKEWAHIGDLLDYVIPTGAMLQENVWQGKDIPGEQLYEQYSVWEVNIAKRTGDDNAAILHLQDGKQIHILFIVNPYVQRLG